MKVRKGPLTRRGRTGSPAPPSPTRGEAKCAAALHQNSFMPGGSGRPPVRLCIFSCNIRLDLGLGVGMGGDDEVLEDLRLLGLEQ